MKKIDCEAHFFTLGYADYLCRRKEFPREVNDEDNFGIWFNEDVFQKLSPAFQGKLLDMGEGRLKDMDEGGIDMQVLSLCAPGVQSFETEPAIEWARSTNDELAALVKKYPDRFIGLASVAPQDPDRAAEEIERVITKLGLHGVNLLSHARDEYFDDKKYWAIFEAAEKLEAPIYLHPTTPSKAILKAYADYGFALAGPGLGFAADAAVHVMRLIYSGLFDRYPKLKIILGHLGEGLPFWLSRLDFLWISPVRYPKPGIEQKPSDYLKKNFIVNTSGMFFHPAFMCTYLAMGADRIALGIDYPYGDYKSAVHFMNEAPICDSDREKIFHGNLDKLFKLG